MDNSIFNIILQNVQTYDMLTFAKHITHQFRQVNNGSFMKPLKEKQEGLDINPRVQGVVLVLRTSGASGPQA